MTLPSKAGAIGADATPIGADSSDAGEPPALQVSEPPDDTCPRCGGTDEGRRFYGPCASCREALGVVMRREARDVAVAGYVPKMNVVPNHVATKE